MIRKTIKVALLLLHLSFKAFTFQPKHVPTAPLQQSYLFGTRSADKMPPGQRQFSLTMSTTSSSSSSSSLFLRRKHSLGRLLKSVLSFPLRFILFGPWKLISQLILVNDVDVDDGTVSIEGNAVVDPSVVSESMASTAVIGELNDVAVVSAETKKNDLLEIVSGDIFTDAAIASHSPTVAEKAASRTTPLGERWAVAGEGVDLSGNWKVVVTEDFKKEYDEYLAKLGQPLIVRTVALGIIGRTTEDLSQTEHGRCLLIRGTNARGVWDRTLVASGTEIGVDEFDPVQIPVMTADSEKVDAESWWESEGTVHVSWLRGVSRYGGGSFKSKRYLEDGGETYVCESTFYFNDESKKKNKLIWRFRKQN